MFAFTKKWTATWKGHEIVVVNWWNLLLWTGEELFIDGELVDHRRTRCPSLYRKLYAVLHDDGLSYEVQAHIAAVDWGLRAGCKIYIGGALIGGDVDKAFI
jgi:hypothetical protein